MNEPWMKFFTGDYFRDPGVRSVSLAARGLWMDMLCLMHQSARKGYLQHPSGLPFTPVQLARMVGYSVEEIAPVLQELDDSGVFSRTKDGVIYSRRMDRDARKSVACSEAGRRGGGNPALAPPLNATFKGGDKGGDKGAPKGGVKPQSQKSESESEEEADASKKENRARGDQNQLVAYAIERGLPSSDGDWLYDKMLAQGWKVDGRPVKDWQALIRVWQKNGYFPSHKAGTQNNGNTNTRSLVRREVHVPGADNW